MEYIKDKPTHSEKDINLKDAIFVFSSFTFICLAVVFALIVYDVLTIQSFLSFEKPIAMAICIVAASIGLLLFGVILTRYIPSRYIDDTNKDYQNGPLLGVFFLMFTGALFEEILFRGIIQNLIYVFIENQWIAIIATTVLFLGFHIQYFKKTIMLVNIMVPSLTFGWIYFETNNIFVPFLVHFLMNFGITLLFKYNFIRVKR
ncbi:CPBP family intramembrane glutamic endopeptidase [Pradoshia eiseniae]|uniref:CPBP family intramembrane glutamic endopeptidase n=1 Tax=Pradoshia eiseniae TaxID=2064768 RepID=UPI00191C1B61|nr:CPBP family intramembrane glutamic endopeptidase [Pradoshia eiseniae]